MVHGWWGLSLATLGIGSAERWCCILNASSMDEYMSEGFSTIAEELQSLRRWRRQVCSVQVHVLCMLSRSASLWKRNLRQSSHAAACLTSAQQKFAGTWHVEMNSSLHMSKGQQNSAVWPEKFILSLRADCRPRLQAEPGKEVRCCPRNQYIGVYIGGGPQPYRISTGMLLQ